MKTRSTLLFLALAALAAAPFLRAADPADAPPPPPPPHERPDFQEMRNRRMEHLDQQLKLTDDEKARINAIWDKAEADGKALHDDTSLSRREVRRKMRALMKATHDQVRAVLTPDQQKTFDTMRPPPRPHGERPPPPPDDAKTE